MLRRKTLTATNKILAQLAAQLLTLRMILVISGGLAIVWKFMLVDLLRTGAHLDLGQIEDEWRARMCGLLLDEGGLTIVGTFKMAGILILLLLGPFL
jgi:hypothetical protein